MSAQTPGRRTGQAGRAAGAPANLRADAIRNRAKILAATPSALRRNPEASVAEIAAAAGVGRMTLYGHFKTRGELLESALVDSLERAEETLSGVPLDGDPAQALGRLIASSWTFLNEARAVLAAAQKELSPVRIRELHEASEARMRALLERGRDEGAFRRDLPVGWLLTTAHVVMNGAAEEVTAGRLDPDEASRYIDAILQPAFAA
ncbi:TetR/AcrR family transcriptional regulator [Leucobacter sp. wl10]|uniref:TetR/AcrR family transcriptional regulator n=1 Tax=Leucobacter sp. wl10 TaxID=2304677 RepID=UPI000E5AA5B8|nr:TetR family transcriptional regulator [Leucobacter sp. wl10]RGE19043.1 TetR family transcriptional regulator [Leucobacter sp. wl10]